MYDNYKIVAVIPAGRKIFLSHLLDLLLNQPLIDEIHIWINTKDQNDLLYIINLKNPKFKLIESKIKINGINSIHHFFKHCTEEDTIYIRFDDDICFLEHDLVQKLVQFRLENIEYLLVYPNIVNNSMNSMKDHPLWLGNKKSAWYFVPKEAYLRHKHFLDNIDCISKFYCRNYVFDNAIININCICWFGRDFKAFSGIVNQQEEIYLSKILPKNLGKKNIICGHAMVSHFSFRTQLNFLKQTEIFNRYKGFYRYKKLFM